MTAAIISIALVLAPPQFDTTHEREAQPWQPLSPTALSVVSEPPTSLWFIPTEGPWEGSSDVVIASPVTTGSLSQTTEPAPTVPAIPLTLRERALNRLVELGAVPWQIGVFDCIGWHESNWANLRNRQSGDDGVFQINDIHDPQLWAQGLDPYVPEDAATFAWQLSREGRTFKPWVVAPLCVRT